MAQLNECYTEDDVRISLNQLPSSFIGSSMMEGCARSKASYEHFSVVQSSVMSEQNGMTHNAEDNSK